MYMDDADILIAAQNHQESLEFIVSRTKNTAKTWREGIHETCGALCLEECTWYLIHFQ